MKTLGIETSCDETAIAVYDSVEGIIGESVFSQIKMHAEYGGVVPELASRDHCKKIIQVFKDATKSVDLKSIDQIAYTAGPGLLGALLIGESFAKGLALSLNIPLIPVNHLEGHLVSPSMEFKDIKPPYICLLVSGGHSMIVDVKAMGEYEILGQSVDDAIGEAFDKCGKRMGCSYPAGQEIDKLAQTGDPKRFSFPISNLKTYDVSYSGLKTAFTNFLNKEEQKHPNFIQENLNDLCASLQYTLVQIILNKIEKTAKDYNLNQIVIGGGVAANSEIRRELERAASLYQWEVFFPPLSYSTDNAAMIGIAAYYKLKQKCYGSLSDHSLARLKL